MGRKGFVAEHICQAAFELFAREGYEAVSTRDIARHAGVGAASMYRHFPSKEDLGRVVYRRALGPMLEETRSILSAPGKRPERLRQFLVYLYEAYDRRPKALALMCFPPHEFMPHELSLANPDSVRSQLCIFCGGDADRASVLWGAILGPITDRYLRQRGGAMAPLAELLFPQLIHLLPSEGVK